MSLSICVVMGSVVLSICPSCVLYSAGSGVSSVHVVLSVLRSRSLSFVHLSTVMLYVGFRDVYVSVWCCDSYVVRVCGQLYRVWW